MVRIYDLHADGSLAPRHELQLHASAVQSVAITSDGALVASADSKQIIVWDAVDGVVRGIAY